MEFSFLTKDHAQKLLANGAHGETGKDHHPVVKLFTPDAQATWLLTEIVPEEPLIAFGLCDLGLGFPELGYVSLVELSELKGRLGLPIERDKHFEGRYPLSFYTEAARFSGHIVDDPSILEQFQHSKKNQLTLNLPKPS